MRQHRGFYKGIYIKKLFFWEKKTYATAPKVKQVKM